MDTTTETAQPTNESFVALREVTKENLWSILDLDVTERQHNFVASNAKSIAEAHFEPLAHFRAIYADETPVGFCMLHMQPDKGEYYLWRFMIDQRYQGMGFGRQALLIIIDFVKTQPNAQRLELSVVPAEDGSGPFYEKVGFTYTGKVEDGEAIMAIEWE